MIGRGASTRASNPEPDDSPDRGSVAVMAVGVYGGLALLIALSFMNWFVVERRAIEDSLAEMRAYWASAGHAAYVLSRTMQEGNCAGAGCTENDPPYAQTAQKYLNEIDGGKGGINLETWRYPDVSGSYQFAVSSVVCADPLAPPGKLGELLVVLSVAGDAKCPPAPPASGPPPAPPPCPSPSSLLTGTGAPPEALRSVPMIRPIEVRYCLVADGITTCGAGPGKTSTPGRQLITSVHRPRC